MLTGQNGILTQAQNSQEKTIAGEEKEQIELAYSSIIASKLENSVTSRDLQEELDKMVGADKTKVTGSSILKVTFKETNNVYTISGTQGVEEYKKAEVTPVYAFLCDADGDGTGETLVLSSTETIEGYTIITNYGDNEEYQINNKEVAHGSVYYYPIWRNETSSITKVIIYNKIVPTMTERWFNNCTNLKEIENLGNLDTSNVTTMTCMFMNCTFTQLNLSSFDTSSVTQMASMFSGCTKLTDLDVSNFDTSNVTTMAGMFTNCSSLVNLDLSSFDTSNVTRMSTMFSGCTKLTDLDVSNFDTSNVTTMGMMFSGCTKLKTILVSSQWTNENVYDSFQMFYNCTSLVGGAGTVYNASYIEAEYAHIDEGETNPGYFTLKD